MSIKSVAAKLFASKIYHKTQVWANKPVETQSKVFESLISDAKETVFGKDHHFKKIKTVDDFQKNVPVRDYEDLKLRIFSGKENQFILQKPLEQPQAQNTFRSQKSQCHLI